MNPISTAHTSRSAVVGVEVEAEAALVLLFALYCLIVVGYIYAGTYMDNNRNKT